MISGTSHSTDPSKPQKTSASASSDDLFQDPDTTIQLGDDIVVEVAEKVADEWTTLAAYLSAKLFPTANTNRIKDEHPRKTLDQARAMLDVWISKAGSRATRRKLIEAMCKMGRRAQANDVFGQQVVESVAPMKDI